MTEIKPKAIFFDWFGTLSNSSVLEHLSDKDHPLFKEAKHIRDFLYIQKNGQVLDVLKGTLTMQGFCNALSRSVGVPSWELLREFATSFSNFKWVDPLIPKYLTAIRQNGIKTVLMNNASESFRKYTVPALNLNKCFDAILLSTELHCFKYDTSLEDLLFFKDFLGENHIKYEECFIVDDMPEEKILNIFDIPYEKVTDESALKAVMKKYI